VNISVDAASVATAARQPLAVAASAISIQIFSPVAPASSYVAQNLTGLDPDSNPYLDSLYSGSPNSYGIATGHLSDQFATVSSGWNAALGSLTTTISLELYATLSVVSNGSTSIFTFYNNLPYDPRAPPTTFSSTVVFPSQPSFAVQSTEAISSGVAPDTKTGGGGNSCTAGWGWVANNETAITGDLPLVLVNVEPSPANSEVSYGISYASGTFEVSFNGDTYTANTQSVTSVQMSTSASASATETGFQSVIVTSDAGTLSGGSPVTMIALADVAMVVTNYQWKEVTSTCEVIGSVQLYMGTLTPLGLTTSTFDFVDAALPSWFPQVMTWGKDWASFATVSMPGDGGGFDLYTEMSQASGYSTANNAYQGVEDFLSGVETDLGTMAAASAALGLLPGDGDADAAACVAVIAAIAGWGASAFQMFNSISFSTTVNYAIEGYAVNHSPQGQQGTLAAQINAQTIGTELSLSSGSYYPDMPLVYVAVS
jgi:hypothetical protein